MAGPSMIKSENGRLRSYVTLNVRDRDIVGFVEWAQRLGLEDPASVDRLVLRRYVAQVESQLPGVRLQFMQSSGGLTDAVMRVPLHSRYTALGDLWLPRTIADALTGQVFSRSRCRRSWRMSIRSTCGASTSRYRCCREESSRTRWC